MGRVPVSLGLDLGTSGIKAVLMDQDGVVRAAAGADYAVSTPSTGWAETPPERWESAARAVVADVLGQLPEAEVAGVGIDGQMHGLVLVDAAGQQLRPGMLWADGRATEQVSHWLDAPTADTSVLANPIVAGMSGPMLRWVKDQEPEVFRRARAALSPKDWLRSRLVPAILTDPTDASATLMWDVPADDWAWKLMEQFGIDTGLLPALREPDQSVGELSAATAAIWNLPAGIPVSVGCGDVASTIYGLDAAGDEFTMIVGTGGQVIRTSAPARSDPEPTYHTYRAVGGSYFAMSAVQNAGLALQWVIDRLGASWDELYAAVPRQPDSDQNLIFLPYLVGERAPLRIGSGNAGWRNASLATTRTDLLRSAVEGVAFALRVGLEALPPAPDSRVRIVGGGVRSGHVRQLLADVLGRPVSPVAVNNVTAAGAGRLGWTVAGRPDVRTALVQEEPIAPSAAAQQYQRQWELFGAGQPR